MSASDLLSMIFSSNPAEKAASQRPQDQGIFSSAMNYLQNNPETVNNGHLDIERMQKTHNQVYGSGGTKAPDANDLGATAVIDVSTQTAAVTTSSNFSQVLKKFGGGSGDVSGKGAQNPAQFQALAMQQASQLYDKQSANGNVRGTMSQRISLSSANNCRWH